MKKDQNSSHPFGNAELKQGPGRDTCTEHHQGAGQTSHAALQPSAGPSRPSPHLMAQISPHAPRHPLTPQEQTRQLVTCLTPFLMHPELQ